MDGCTVIPLKTGEFAYRKPLDLLKADEPVKICAPMVRYTKLPFRMLVRRYDCDIVYTPMIMADSFVQSDKARHVEFTTAKGDRPLIAQFAAKTAEEFSSAAQLIAPYVDGVDLNCGCPQRWALQEGVGASLIKKPQLLADIVKQTRNQIPDPDFTVSVKIRIHDDLKETVSLCQQVESAGASWITVHGRTILQRAQPVNIDAIALIKSSVALPVVANGDIKCLDDMYSIAKRTGVNGVMAARGILSNPAMYAGHSHTPLQCVQDWCQLALDYGCSFTQFHHHLMFMLEDIMPRSERRVFNCLHSTTAVLDYLRAHYDLSETRNT